MDVQQPKNLKKMFYNHIKFIEDLCNLAGIKSLKETQTVDAIFTTLTESKDETGNVKTIVGDERRYIDAVRKFVNIIGDASLVSKDKLFQIKDYKINTGLTFEDTTKPTQIIKRKLFFTIGYAYSKTRGFAGQHAFEKHKQEFRDIINSIPSDIRTFAEENVRQLKNQYLHDFEYLLLTLPYVIKYDKQIRTVEKINDICALYNDCYTVLAKITDEAFSGDSNYYLKTIYLPNETKKSEFNRLFSENKFKNFLNKKRGY